MPKFTLGAVITATLLVAFMRLLPHPPNFTPILSLALWAGAATQPRWLFALPIVAAMAVTDLILGFHDTQLLIYALLILIGAFALLLDHTKLSRVLAAGTAASLFFYFASNTAVWYGSGMYPRNQVGGEAAMMAGLPFLSATVLSTLLFSVLFWAGTRAYVKHTAARTPYTRHFS
jgi:hypothetical protein